MSAGWLTVTRGHAPLLVSLPHTGTLIPADVEARLVSPWLARVDADWWIDRLYSFAADLGATVVHTAVSRTVIDVNRDPSGVSLYPGQATTGLCPTETFDGVPLYRAGREPSDDEIAERRRQHFEPYHAALGTELARLSATHGRVVLYDCHSIRSVIPRLFDGELPRFNVGTNDGASCDPALTRIVERACDRSGASRVTNGRFKGGYITRHYGRPGAGVHAIQMEMACRAYMREPAVVTPATWPSQYQDADAARTRAVLHDVLSGAVAWARGDIAAGAAAEGTS
ncbi:MAG: N-formylglutamate deformylase [Vicinamibacterales bacterium]